MSHKYHKLVNEKWAMASSCKRFVLVGFLVVFLSSVTVKSSGDGDGECSWFCFCLL